MCRSLSITPLNEDPTPSHASELAPILSSLSTSNMQANLNTLTAYNNRYYKATTGSQASSWIKDKIQSVRLVSVSS